MPFHFTCPYCYKKTLVDDGLAGEKGPCAGCGKEVVIPAPPDVIPKEVHPVDAKYVHVSENKSDMRHVAWILKGIGLVVIVAILSSLSLYLFWPTLNGLMQRRNKVACMNNLQVIANALNAYAADHGAYPTPVVYDAKGKPMHSWRVLILPYLGEDGVYAQYDFNSAWDSTENSQVLSQCPRVFISPASDDPFASESSYFLITGKNTVFPPKGPLRPSEITDGPGGTLLVVEKKNMATEWTKPQEIDASKLDYRIGSTGNNAIGGNHDGGATGVFADGTPAWLPEDLDPVLLDAIITPQSAEPIDPNDYQLE